MRNPVIALSFLFNLSPYKKMQDKALKILHEQSTSVIEKRREELENQKTCFNLNDVGKHIIMRCTECTKSK